MLEQQLYPPIEPRRAHASRLNRLQLRLVLGVSLITAAALLFVANPTSAPVIEGSGGPAIVNSTNDVNDGNCNGAHCSLREAIIAMNTSSETSIFFSIPGAGPHTITVDIGTNGPLPSLAGSPSGVGVFGDTQPGYAGTPQIRLVPSVAFSGHCGLSIAADGLKVTGIAFSDWTVAVCVSGNNDEVALNFIGTDPTGTIGDGNDNGIAVFGDGAVIRDNIISANNMGVGIDGGSSSNRLYGNRIGTGLDYSVSIPNIAGMQMSNGSSSNIIGGASAGERNVVAFNSAAGIIIDGASSDDNQIRRNSIHSNGGDGIDFSNNANNDVILPVITSTSPVGGTACFECVVEVFSTDVNGEGRRFEGSAGVFGSNWTLTTGPVAGPYVTATLTDPSGDTSEFTTPVAVAVSDLRESGEFSFNILDPSPGAASPAYIDVQFPGTDQGADDFSIEMQGSDWFPGTPPAFGTVVGRIRITIDHCALGSFVLASTGSFTLGIPITYEDPAGPALAYFPDDESALDVTAALLARGSDTKLYTSTGSAVSGFSLEGEIYAYLLYHGGGRSELVFSDVGADSILDCIRLTRVEFLAYGIAGASYVRLNPATPGYYGALARYRSDDSPRPGGRERALIPVCVLIRGIGTPVGDRDGDCIDSEPFVPLDPDIPDVDQDGVLDGFDGVFCGDDSSADGDGDGFPDDDECFFETDAFDSDSDNDFVFDGSDNCPNEFNPPQDDIDFDGYGGDCDWDRDGDGLTNDQEASTSGLFIGAPLNKAHFECVFDLTPTLALNPDDQDTDGDGVTDGAGCNLGEDPANAASTIEICDGLNNDGDALTDEVVRLETLNEWDTNPANCLAADPDHDGAAGNAENIVQSVITIGGFGISPALNCALTAIFLCDADGDSLNYNVDRDSDGDSLADLFEFAFSNTSPISLDTDEDGVNDGLDTCPGSMVAQTNSDSGPMPPTGNTGVIDNGTLLAPVDDTVANGDPFGDECDEDHDNDGLDDADEDPLASCGAFNGAGSGHPNPESGDVSNDDDANGDPAVPMGGDAGDNGPSWDTDNDGFRDGIECILLTNPRDRTSKPLSAACGGAADVDGDGLFKAWETCKWGTSDFVDDSDNDGLGDCKEVADIDGDTQLTFPGDVLNLANVFFSTGKAVALDVDGDGLITFPGDVLTEAGFFFGTCM